MFSKIQNDILARLKNASRLRYSELKPEKTANDLFNYHLQFLVKKEYVDRDDDGYALADKGVKHVADPIPDKDSRILNHLFKVNVITVVSRIVDGKIEILNQRRKSNPSYGIIGVMGGVVNKGETTTDAAKRKLNIETGLDANFKYIGTERRIMYQNSELFSDIYFPIAYATDATGELVEETEYGQNMWVPIDQAIRNDDRGFDSIAAILKVLKAIKNGTVDSLSQFYTEEIKTDFKPAK
jgi:8-oxo-dGTP pyrophosphatase MutT (NUDIX family)